MRIPGRAYVVAGMFLLSVLLYVDRVCISAAKEDVARDLALGEKEMGWVLAAFALGYALFQAPGGWLADRLGPRRVLAAVVVFWSVFTGFTAAAWNAVSLLAARFLFGAGEAGAFPGMARASFAWFPMAERGTVQGVGFAGSRLGAAFALPLVAWMVAALGWRETFVVLMGVGFVWATAWLLLFRDDPASHPRLDPAERDFILAARQQASGTGPSDDRLRLGALLASGNLWTVSAQYFCSNFTFFFCLTWFFPHLKRTYVLDPVEAGLYAGAPFVGGAIGNVLSGRLVDRLYASGRWVASRRLPAILGFLLAAVGAVGTAYASGPLSSIAWFTLAVFGADMTLAPSWSFCIDIGRRRSGVVSGIMNMAGNLGSFVTALAFPHLAAWTGSNTPFFFVAAGLSLAAALLWLAADPRRPLEGVA
jgi:ACS family glucarate transporter-like MFS transporter